MAQFNLWIEDKDWVVTIPDDELEGLEDGDREAFINAWLNDEILQHISAGWAER